MRPPLMMEQGSPEWIKRRLGMPTASAFERIITPGGKAASGAAVNKFLAQLVAEWFIDEPVEAFANGYTDRGTEMEPEARKWYGWEYGIDPEQVGLCIHDDGRTACSPDSLIGDDGLLEIKCPGATAQAGYVLGHTSPVAEYRAQLQGQLWVTGREFVDLLAYHPALPKLVVRVQPDAEYQRTLDAAIPAFCDRLDEAKAKLRQAKADYDAQRRAEHEREMEDIPAGIS